MDEVPESLFWRKVETHHGLFLVSDGVTEFTEWGLRRRIERGQFVAQHRGILRVVGSPVTPRQTLLGLAWALNGPSTASSSLALHGVPGYELSSFEIVRNARSGITRKLDGIDVTVHRSNLLPPHHVTEIDGIPTTTLARAICDMSARVSVPKLARLVDNCKRLKKIEYAEIAACREDLRARGRRKTTFLDLVLADRVAGWVVGESPPEDKVRGWLIDARYEPVTQHWVVANGKRRRLDIALPEYRVAIEYQGVDAHATAAAVVDDSEKITELQLAGWFVVLVTKKTTQAEFLHSIRTAIRRQSGVA